MLKKSTLFLTLLFAVYSTAPVADECSVDLLRLTKVETLKSASGWDNSSGKLLAQLSSLYLDMPMPQKINKTYAVDQSAVIFGQEYIYDPLEKYEDAFVKIVEQVTNAIGNSIEDPDQLILRVNGTAIGPRDEGKWFKTMNKNQSFPYVQESEVTQSFRNSATLQLIEWDEYANDNLGSVNFVSAPVLNNRVPVDSNSTFYLNVSYRLVSSTIDEGNLIFLNSGLYSFFVGSEFDDLEAYETREVTFTYDTRGFSQFSSVPEYVKIGDSK